MAAALPGSRPLWFSAVALLAVIWNGFGVAMYLRSVGVFGDPTAGLIGSLGLLLGKAGAQPVLIVSLIALLVLEGWVVLLSGAVEAFGLAFPIIVSAGAILLAWLATHGRRRGWLT